VERHPPIDPQRDTAFIFAGGDDVPVDVSSIEIRAGLLIAADSGLDFAERAGLTPDMVVGDMDSVTPAALNRAREAGAEIVLHPTNKNATDLELALDAVVAHDLRKAVVVGGGGGRLSHLLGNATLLAAGRYRDVEVEWWMGPTRVLVTRPGRPASIAGSPGDLVSLIPLEPIDEVTSVGLEWKLDGDHLGRGTSRGISNRLIGTAASIAIGAGVLLVVVERGDA
jgi:thiamine pyrophosphokinase